MKDTIDFSGMTAERLSLMGQDIYRTNSPETVAWVYFLARHWPDDEEVFPKGKWATIQEFERQLEECAKEYVAHRRAARREHDPKV